MQTTALKARTPAQLVLDAYIQAHPGSAIPGLSVVELSPDQGAAQWRAATQSGLLDATPLIDLETLLERDPLLALSMRGM